MPPRLSRHFFLLEKANRFAKTGSGQTARKRPPTQREKTAALRFFVTGIWLTACSPYGVLVVLARAAQATAVIFGSALMFCAYKGQGLGFMIALMLVFSCLVCESGMRECLSFLPVPSLSWQSIEVFCACPEPVLANRRRFSCMKTQTHTHNCRVCFLQVVNLGETHRAIYVQLSSRAAASCLRSVTKPSKQASN